MGGTAVAQHSHLLLTDFKFELDSTVTSYYAGELRSLKKPALSRED
jgi:hypothetical protein